VINKRVWMVVGLLVLALGAVGVIFGMNLLPTGEAAEAKGTYAPWLGTWIMIWCTAAMTVILAGYLFSTAMGKNR
jgi:hypothetical protein